MSSNTQRCRPVQLVSNEYLSTISAAFAHLHPIQLSQLPAKSREEDKTTQEQGYDVENGGDNTKESPRHLCDMNGMDRPGVVSMRN